MAPKAAQILGPFKNETRKIMVILYISGGVGVVDGTMTVVHAGNCTHIKKKPILSTTRLQGPLQCADPPHPH